MEERVNEPEPEVLAPEEIMASKPVPDLAPTVIEPAIVQKSNGHTSPALQDTFQGMKAGHQHDRLLVIGHRGNGKNKTLLQGESPDARPTIRENTITSFNTASNFGADFVEFDVQVTKDGHPIVFHDDYIIAEDKVPTKIGELTLNEFLSMGPQKGTSEDGRPLHRRAKDGYVGLWTATMEDPLCTLQEVFESVDQSVGFNIEVKFDDVLETYDEELRRVIFPILEVVKQHASGRRIYYSSFHPDAVHLLRKEQSCYPVFFLTDGGVNMYNDPRRNSIQAAIQVCQDGHLQGIVSEVRAILHEPGLVSVVKQATLWLFTYGDLNNVAEVMEKQKILGVDGVIVDFVLEMVTMARDLEKHQQENMLGVIPIPLSLAYVESKGMSMTALTGEKLPITSAQQLIWI